MSYRFNNSSRPHRKGTDVIRRYSFLIVAILLIIYSVCATSAQAKNNFEFTGGLGFVAGSPSGTGIAQNFMGAYYLREDLSIGAMVQLMPPEDYIQVAGAMFAQYHFPFSRVLSYEWAKSWRLSPLIGLGGVHAELKRDGIHNSNMSYYAAPGISLDYLVNKSFGLSALYISNLYDLKVESNGGHDRSSHAFFIGITFRPPF